MALEPRQIWWLATVAATASGLALAAFGRSLPWRVLGIALLLAPHLVGAPRPGEEAGVVPAALLHRFIVGSLAANLLFWLVLGLGSWFFLRRAATVREPMA